MGGFDDHVAVLGDGMPLSNPGALFASMVGNDTAAYSIKHSSSENRYAPLNPGTEGLGVLDNTDHYGLIQASTDDCKARNSNVLTEPKMISRGCLMERMTSRAGFHAPKLNTEIIRPADLSKNVAFPFAISSGFSPTVLLDSPVFLENSMVQPSPTTGKFLFAPSVNNRSSTLATIDHDKENIFEDTSSFVFQPNAESANKASGFAQQSFLAVHSNASLPHQIEESPDFQTFSESQAENKVTNLSLEQPTFCAAENSSPFDDPQENERSSSDSNVGNSQAEDGYNWRKYGQKQVKGSEYPRSYYKCTHPNCPVKKKVECSPDGQITEIIYKGAHNHPKPNHGLSLGSSNMLGDVQLQYGDGTQENGNLIWLNSQRGGISGAHDWRQNSLGETPSAHVVHENTSGPTSTLQAQNGPQIESGDGLVDGSCTLSNNEDDVPHGSVSLGYDCEGDELESKRRRIETYASEMSGATRAIREPRVVVQTTSEIDILDDGYRWRKYGQKVVKGNPNPRSYYKCTSPGCNVRKHVERASHDLKAVITTYEGKHNHGVPAARNSSHINTGGPSALPTQKPPVAVSSHLHHSQIHSSSRPGLASFSLPGSGIGLGMNLPSLGNLGLASLCPNPGKLPARPFFGLPNPPQPINDIGFLLPKAEPKLELVTDSNLNDPSFYQQVVGRLPLGPQM